MSDRTGRITARLHRLFAVIAADVRIRLRRPSTAVVFVLLSAMPYLWIPAPSTGRAVLAIEGRRALYNSAAIGTATAALATVFIGLFGFYVISNALRRDVLTRCGFVIASTTLRGSEYIAGKFAGNVAFLSIFSFGFMLTAMAMVIVRGEAPLEPLVFAKQYLLLLPPSIVFVSAIALLFECTPFLRSKVGDLLYFFVWLAAIGAVVAFVEGGAAPAAAAFDISGIGFVVQQMKSTYHTTNIAIGGTTFDATRGPIVFRGLDASGGWLLLRVAATLWPLSLLAIARLFFHRFDPARVRVLPNERAHSSWLGRLNRISKPFVRVGYVAGTTLPRAALTDAMTTLAVFPLAGIAIVAFAIAALVADPRAVLPAAFVACALALADVATREKRAATTSLVYALPQLRERFVLWKFLSALFVAIAFLAIPLARLAIARPTSILAALTGLAVLVAAATALGIVSATPKTFLVVFLTFWYVVMSDKGATPALDFAGWNGTATPAVTLTYAAVAMALLAAAHLFHATELRRA